MNWIWFTSELAEVSEDKNLKHRISFEVDVPHGFNYQCGSRYNYTYKQGVIYPTIYIFNEFCPSSSHQYQYHSFW